MRSLVRAGLQADLLTFPPGERHKTRETKARLEDALARIGMGGDGLVVALGGGVVGDLGGFVAATWHRGIPLVQAPTSLIAMLDASIGGKVAVDHPRAKNLIGAFHAPRAVYADTRTLGTLHAREFRAGIAEAVKCGAIADAGLFRFLERRRREILRREEPDVLDLVVRTARVKARIVTADAQDRGRRMLLNFGHTLGHALEAVSGYRLRHGEAVAIGLVLESRIAVRLGLLSREHGERIERLVRTLGLPAEAPAGFPARAVLAAAHLDKKARAGQSLFVLPCSLGAHAGGGNYVFPVPERLILEVLG